MTGLLHSLSGLYARLLRLLPVAFRTQFEAEMREVFAQSLGQAITQGRRSFLTTCWRELRDLPRLLVSQHRQHWILGRQERLMLANPIPNDYQPGRPEGDGQGTWPQALLAGLPHALLAALVGISSWLSGKDVLPPALQRWAPVFLGLVIIGALALLVVVFLKARREDWPFWTASWLPYLAIPVVMLPIAYLQSAPLGRRAQLDQAFMYVGIPLLLGVLFYLLLRRHRFMALLAALPLVALLWSPVLEFVPSPLRTWLTVITWLLVALTATVGVRLGNPGTAIWLALGMNLLIGLPYAYAQTYLKVLPPGAPAGWSEPPAMLDLANTFVPHFLGTATLVLGPALIWHLRSFGRRGGSQGLWSYRLAAIGFSMMVIGNLGAFWWMLRHWPSGDFLLYQVMVYGGLGLYLFASIRLLAGALEGGRVTEAAPPILLVLVLLILPLVLALPLLLGMRSMPRTMPFDFLHIHDSRPATYVVGLAWLIVAAWLAARPTWPAQPGPKLPPRVLATTLMGLLPIVAFGLYPVLHEGLGWPFNPSFLIAYTILLAGFAVAWFQGFPRWSFSYLGLLVAVSWGQMWLLNRWLWARLADVGLVQGTSQVPRWPVWALLLLLLAILASAGRSLRPLGRLVDHIRQDWTLLSFALFGIMAWFLPAITDENHNPYLVVGLAITAVALAWGAVGYLLQTTPVERMLSLLAGLTIAFLATDLVNATYWILRYSAPGPGYAPNMIIGWAILMVILLLPGLPGWLRRAGRSLRQA